MKKLKKLSKSCRDQAVELLRCACDIAAFGEASVRLGTSMTVYLLADEARMHVWMTESCSYLHALLEAAARIEEGSWP